MSEPKATTIQQRFGFNDKDLTTPEHDKIMLWLDENIEEVMRKIFKISPVEKIKTKWEYPIIDQKGRSGFIIGFIDMAVQFVEILEWEGKTCLEQKNALFEVKTKIPSLGELFRQLNMYKQYADGKKIVVVSPDTRFKKQIENQGFMFIESPNNL